MLAYHVDSITQNLVVFTHPAVGGVTYHKLNTSKSTELPLTEATVA